MSTLLGVRNSVRAAVDQDGYTAVTDAQLNTWIGQEYSILTGRLTSLFPDRYTKYTADYTVANGARSFVITETDFSRIREVQRKDGATGVDYFSLMLAPGYNPEWACDLSFRQRGAATVDLFPIAVAPGTYRVRYAYKPVTLVADGEILDVPDGGDQVIEHIVGARVRGRFEEDPSLLLNLRDSSWKEYRDSLMPFYVGTSEGITEVNRY